MSYKADHVEFRKFLNSPMLAAAVMRVAIGIKERAEMSAPVGGPGDPHRGRYKASFEIRLHRHGGATKDRVEAIVKNTSPEAVFVEWGTMGDEPYHTLLKAAVEGRL